MDVPWWQTAVFYQIYPRSFASSRHGPVGDLRGIEQRLDHLTWLGVDAVWLSPIFPSPMADFGYDVADYVDIDPLFGTLGDFDRLLGACHDRGRERRTRHPHVARCDHTLGQLPGGMPALPPGGMPGLPPGQGLPDLSKLDFSQFKDDRPGR